MGQDYGLIIIGGGSAGLMAASLAVQLDMGVAIVERDRLGGDCTWTGYVPSKTLLKTARVAHQMRSADHFGLPAVEPEIDFKAVMATCARSLPGCRPPPRSGSASCSAARRAGW